MNLWPDFLFTVAARFLGGAPVGGFAGVVIGHRGTLRALSHGNRRSAALGLSGCGLVGGLAGVLATPHWQTPWYEGIRSQDEDAKTWIAQVQFFRTPPFSS